ncbi:hypothetical protein CEP54_012336 [Fusarium duplospermum]|uniref:Uncharacterized protein n=1 Tax=Fusarium duplospermum TaxID=1325734 RepID=A0A428P9A8_9HYPO|nr:hypothetical protein CEP54_012336 [Fusarium duplospermum]
MTLVYDAGTPLTTRSSPLPTTRPLTKMNTDRLPVTTNIRNYLRHHQNFEAIPLGISRVPKDMVGYCQEWQAKFDAAGKKA